MGELTFAEYVQLEANWDHRQRQAFLQLLLVDGIGSVLARRLLAHFGDPRQVLHAAEAELQQIVGVGPKLARQIKQQATQERLEAELTLCCREGVRLVWPHDPSFPKTLHYLHAPPLVLWMKGQLLPEDRVAVAVVGSRAATAYGLRQTHRLVSRLASFGFTIVSGLARGIDAAAHRAALSAGGRTIAVLAGGLHDIYPPEHFELAERIANHGALISENPMSQKPKSGLFPMRNRIIAGLSMGVLVVEAAVHSGAMITVAHALDQGKEVFAVPGPVDSPTSQGCHQLIRDGAHLVQCAEDVAEILAPNLPRPAPAGPLSPAAAPLSELSTAEKSVLDALETDSMSFDELTAATGLDPALLGSTLTHLELRGLVQRDPGGRFSRRERPCDLH